VIGERQLVAQCDLVFAAMFESKTQQIAEPCQHAIGRVHIPVHQRRDAVQSIEQEMWMNL
jgi:hypothetical protein